MSTDRKRLTSAIQRIAREDPEIRDLLNDFRNSGGKPSESATAGSGAEDRQICCDGGTSGSTNPGSDTRDPSENPQDGIDPDDPAKISDNLTGVTDCATGQPICFAGSDWIPPDGWDGPTDPPPDPTFDSGWYAVSDTGSGGSKVHRTCAQAFARYAAELSPCNLNLTSTCDDLFTAGAFTGCSDSFDNSYSASYVTINCGNNYNTVCEEPAPLLDSWPSDGCVNLAIKGGKIVGSKFDPENDGTWSAPRDEVELCDAFGNSFKLKASGSVGGGWKSISAQNPDDGYLYDSSGKQIARISESEYSDPTM